MIITKIKLDDDKIVLYVINQKIDFDIFCKEKIESFLKNIIVKLKKKGHKISGFYNVNVYQNNNYGFIVEFKKESDLDFFPDLIDLKMNIFYDSDIYLELDDYFLIDRYANKFCLNDKWYVNINNLSNMDLIRLIEFCNINYCLKK